MRTASGSPNQSRLHADQLCRPAPAPERLVRQWLFLRLQRQEHDAEPCSDRERRYQANGQGHRSSTSCSSSTPAPAARARPCRPSAAAHDNPYSTSPTAPTSSTWSISPYLQHRFGPTADCTAALHARFGRCRRRASAAATANASTCNLASGSIFRDARLGPVQYRRQQIDDENAGDFDSENALANLRYRLAHPGADRHRRLRQATYEDLGGRTAGQQLVGRLHLDAVRRARKLELAGSAHSFFGKTGSLSAATAAALVWSLTLQRPGHDHPLAIPAAASIDTAAMLDAPVQPTIRDPVRRAAGRAGLHAGHRPAAQPGQQRRLPEQPLHARQKQLRGRRLQLAHAAADRCRCPTTAERTVLSSAAEPTATLLGSQLAAERQRAPARHRRRFNYRLSRAQRPGRRLSVRSRAAR
jgi:hypothetical protein